MLPLIFSIGQHLEQNTRKLEHMPLILLGRSIELLQSSVFSHIESVTTISVPIAQYLFLDHTFTFLDILTCSSGFNFSFQADLAI